jgi:phosphoribosylanthranilate isomerase
MALNPFAVDISSGAETEGVKDREKILRLVEKARYLNWHHALKVTDTSALPTKPRQGP